MSSSRWAVLLMLVLAPAASRAQTPYERASLETTIGVDLFRGDNVSDRPQIIVDIIGTVQLSEQWQVQVRPWFRLPRPSPPTAPPPPWDVELYQARRRLIWLLRNDPRALSDLEVLLAAPGLPAQLVGEVLSAAGSADTPAVHAFLVVLVLYWAVPFRVQQWLILAASYVFYGWWGFFVEGLEGFQRVLPLLLLIVSTIATHVCDGRQPIGRERNEAAADLIGQIIK